ncbi:ketopantoate reductase family protein [Shouchella shacheensis]|uniref:ketopantoate reductase family protein n=1 Tax=Shouchella shacheensis TaxID=1649580 RepID=UPI00073FF329|nr:ketopantoate reductase family protein [Shouchella shacheensis]
MRILSVGAGGVGGYFGARLAEKGEDVTFLVREKRKHLLEEKGLAVRSIHGDLTMEPKLITKNSQALPFDVILLSTKAYHLEQAIGDVRPFICEHTVILPLLNGIAHIPVLQKAFGEDQVIGGLCFIETTVDKDGAIRQTSPTHRLMFGELDGTKTERTTRLEEAFEDTKASIVLSEKIEQEMWHKYLFITVASGITTLFRSPIGPVRESENGREFTRGLFEETASIMREHGAKLADNIVDKHMETMDAMTYEMKSSLLRDMEKHDSVEGDHLQGYLLELARKGNVDAPLLHAVYQNLKVYEVRRLQQG